MVRRHVRAISRPLVSWILLDPFTELSFLPLMKLKVSIATFKAKAVLFEILYFFTGEAALPQ